MTHCFTLEMGKGHLSDRWTNTCENDLMELEASKVLRRSGVLGVGDVFSGLHIQEQGWQLAPREGESPDYSPGFVQR